MKLFNIFKKKDMPNEKVLVAYSEYFKSYIRVCKYKSNNDWTFTLCNSMGFIKSKPMIARTQYDKYKWNSIKRVD